MVTNLFNAKAAGKKFQMTTEIASTYNAKVMQKNAAHSEVSNSWIN
jgi:hypothetical protein